MNSTQFIIALIALDVTFVITVLGTNYMLIKAVDQHIDEVAERMYRRPPVKASDWLR